MLKNKYTVRANTGIVLIILFSVITYGHWATYSRGFKPGLMLLKKVVDNEYGSIKKDETSMSQRDTKSENNAIVKSDISRGPEYIEENKTILKGDNFQLDRNNKQGLSGEDIHVSIKGKAVSFVNNFYGKDKGSIYEQRFKDIKEVLPQDKMIGDITDRGDYADFIYTQYVLSPIILNNYKIGKSGISSITSSDTTGQDVLIAGEASDFDAVKWFRPLNKDDEFERGLVVGNLYDYDIDSMQRTLKSENLLLVKDYGDGVLLLKRGED